jgi:hypothetical protein
MTENGSIDGYTDLGLDYLRSISDNWLQSKAACNIVDRGHWSVYTWLSGLSVIL